MAYGDVIRRARTMQGLTQAQLAESTGIDQANISAIETGRRLPSIETFHRLLVGCGFELVAHAGPDRQIALWLPEWGQRDSRPPPVPMTADERRARFLEVQAAFEADLRRRPPPDRGADQADR